MEVLEVFLGFLEQSFVCILIEQLQDCLGIFETGLPVLELLEMGLQIIQLLQRALCPHLIIPKVGLGSNLL